MQGDLFSVVGRSAQTNMVAAIEQKTKCVCNVTSGERSTQEEL
jgi:hypothetical protein